MGRKLEGDEPKPATLRQRRYRAKVRRRLIVAGDRAGLRTPQPRPEDTEFWPTTRCLIAALIGWVFPHLPEGTIWELAAGAGPLVDAKEAAGRRVNATDIDPQRRGIRRHDVHDTPPPDTVGTIAVTNPPWSDERLDPFIARVLSLLDSGHLRAVVLLLRIDHTGAGGRADILNRAAFTWTCCWRPRWVPGTKGNGRWWCVWALWLPDVCGPPVNRYLAPADMRAAGVWPGNEAPLALAAEQPAPIAPDAATAVADADRQNDGDNEREAA
jgi:hypothetical protein